METKRKIRRDILTKRDQLSKTEWEKFSAAIFQHLVLLPEYHTANVLLGFVSYQSEVNTIPILTKAFADGKKVAVPKVFESDLKFYEIQSLQDLTEGYKGILEPCEQYCKQIIDFSKGLMLMPGVVFDEKGNRIGYGKGFYDRFLAKEDFKGLKVALSFELQVVSQDTFEVEETDQRPDILITEKGLRRWN